VERPLRREAHGGCGERPGETGREQSWRRAPGPLDRAALPLSRKTLNYVAGIIRRHLEAIGSRWRKLNPGQQALLVLAYLCKGETFAELAAGFGIGRTTAWRYVNETVELLAARAPKLRAALCDVNSAGHAYVILDGTLIPVDRVRRRPALLFRQAQEARYEPADHSQSGWGHPVGVRGTARISAR
jgi:Helix-turn-helix of DDE superfamily endonuclease